MEVRSLAEQLGNPLAVEHWLRENWVVIPDPEEAEYIQQPGWLLRFSRQCGALGGDCDDAATLAASLLVSISWPCRFVAIRLPHEEEFSHVFLRCSIGWKDLDIDPIVPYELLPIHGVAERMELHV